MATDDFLPWEPPPPPWPWTGQTAMAQAVVETLERQSALDAHAVATNLARRFSREPWRTYGVATRSVIQQVAAGWSYDVAAREPYEGQGTCGSGAAARAVPIGAWFSDDLDVAAEQAAIAGEATHAHPDGIAAAVAVAVAAACAARAQEHGTAQAGRALLKTVLSFVSDGAVRDAIAAAAAIPFVVPADSAATTLAQRRDAGAARVVPLALWCAARALENPEQALRSALSVRGDLRVRGAVTGGIVALSGHAIPAPWIAATEPPP